MPSFEIVLIIPSTKSLVDAYLVTQRVVGGTNPWTPCSNSQVMIGNGGIFVMSPIVLIERRAAEVGEVRLSDQG